MKSNIQSKNRISNWLVSSLALTASTVFASSTLDGETVNTVSATSVTSCNPLSSTSCSADAALATAISEDFQSTPDNYIPYRTPDEIYYGDEGLVLTLAKQYDNPSMVSNFYIMFGKVQVLLKSATGTGIVSSFYLQSDDLDEIDMEWFGGDASQMQSNFFSKGDTTTYDRGEYHDMADPRADYHNYTIDWDEDSLEWYIDGTLVRTLYSNNSQGYPQSPSRLFFGIWAGGDSSNAEGTIEWAGGSTDYSDAPFSMYIKSLIVSDYSSGDEYEYTDTSGDWSSIEAVNGEVLGRKVIAQAEFASLVNGNDIDDDDSDSSSSNSSKSSKSSSSSSTSVIKKSVSTTTGNSVNSVITTTTSRSTDESSDASSSSTSKTVSLQSRYLSSSTTTFSTSTTSSSSSSDASSSSSSASVSTQENGAVGQFYAGPSIITAVVFLVSLL